MSGSRHQRQLTPVYSNFILVVHTFCLKYVVSMLKSWTVKLLTCGKISLFVILVMCFNPLIVVAHLSAQPVVRLNKRWVLGYSHEYFNTDRPKAVLLLWFLTVTCSDCPLYFGSAVMLVPYFVNCR